MKHFLAIFSIFLVLNLVFTEKRSFKEFFPKIKQKISEFFQKIKQKLQKPEILFGELIDAKPEAMHVDEQTGSGAQWPSNRR